MTFVSSALRVLPDVRQRKPALFTWPSCTVMITTGTMTPQCSLIPVSTYLSAFCVNFHDGCWKKGERVNAPPMVSPGPSTCTVMCRAQQPAPARRHQVGPTGAASKSVRREVALLEAQQVVLHDLLAEGSILTRISYRVSRKAAADWVGCADMKPGERIAGHIAALNWHAVRLYRLSRRLHEADHRSAAILVAAVNRALTGVEIPPTAQFGEGLVVMHGVGIVVHPETRAGRNCVLYQGVTLGSSSVDGAPPTLGDNVTLFPGAKALGELTLGDGCQVLANAVVTESFPIGSIVAGIPAVPRQRAAPAAP